MMMYTSDMYIVLLLADGPEQLPLSSDCALNNGSLHVSAVAAVRLVGGNPDFTKAPGHGDDDARFYDRQQAYVHARGG